MIKMDMNRNFKTHFEIGGIRVGAGEPALVVAEIGGNHGGDVNLALEMIDAALDAGCRAVKFQAYKTGSFLAGTSEYFDELAAEELSFEDMARLAEYCDRKGMLFLASVFDFESLILMVRSGAPAIKISSGDLNHFPLLEAAAGTGKPIILSTGASDQEEVARSLDFLHQSGSNEVVLLQCTSMYPCPDDEVNLSVIPFWQSQTTAPIGFSDHSIGVTIPIGAMALGACLVEKHFTIDQNLPGGDNEISCLPHELAQLVEASSRLHKAMGGAEKEPTRGELNLRTAIRRSVVAIKDIKAGEKFGLHNLGFKRPGDYAEPIEYYHLAGKEAKRDMAEGRPVTREAVE